MCHILLSVTELQAHLHDFAMRFLYIPNIFPTGNLLLKADVPQPHASHSSSNNIENTRLESNNSNISNNTDRTSPSQTTHNDPIITNAERPDSINNVAVVSQRNNPATHLKAHLTKKQRRKYAGTSSRGRYGAGGGNSDAKSSKSGVAPQLKVSKCPDKGYCFNGGACKLVVRIQRRFCECPRGFAGRRCERQILQ